MFSDRNRPGGQKIRATPGRPLLVNTGRDDWIRTSDPLLPKQETYDRLRLSSGCAYVPEGTSFKDVPERPQRVVSKNGSWQDTLGYEKKSPTNYLKISKMLFRAFLTKAWFANRISSSPASKWSAPHFSFTQISTETSPF